MSLLAVFDPKAMNDEIRRQAPLPVYLLYGEDAAGIERCRSRLVKLTADDCFGPVGFDGRALPDMDTVADAAISLSFGGGRKCVLIDDIDTAAIPKNDWEKLCELISSPEENTLLIITSRTTGLGRDKKDSRGRKLIELCGRSGGVCEFKKPGRADAAAYASKLAAAGLCTLERDEALLLAESCGCDTLRIGNEVDKLTAYRGGGRITAADIKLLVQPVVEADIFRLSGLLLSGDGSGAMALIDSLIFLREKPENIVSMLCLAFSDIYKACAAREAGAGRRDADKAYGYNGSYRFEKAWDTAGRTDMARAGEAIELLAAAEADIKSTGAEPRAVLESCSASIAGLGRRTR